MEMRRVLIVLFGVLLILAIPGTAYAAAEPNGDSLVVLSGNAFVPVGQVVDSVVVFNGHVRIEGTVTNTVVAFNGPVTITGSVGGDVAVFNGRLLVRDGSHVTGDVYADQRVIAPGATVNGSVSSMSRLGLTSGWASFAVGLVFWLGVVVSTLILGLMLLWFAPRAADAVVRAGTTAVGPSIGWGLAVLVGLPVIGVIAIATLVGIPLGFGILLGLALIFAIGQVTGAWFLGRRLVRTSSRFGAFALGWAILSVAMLVPVIGALTLLAAMVYGLGTLCVAAYRARKAPATVAVSPPMPPAPVSA
jgi:hypothetical protein